MKSLRVIVSLIIKEAFRIRSGSHRAKGAVRPDRQTSRAAIERA